MSRLNFAILLIIGFVISALASGGPPDPPPNTDWWGKGPGEAWIYTWDPSNGTIDDHYPNGQIDLIDATYTVQDPWDADPGYRLDNLNLKAYFLFNVTADDELVWNYRVLSVNGDDDQDILDSFAQVLVMSEKCSSDEGEPYCTCEVSFDMDALDNAIESLLDADLTSFETASKYRMTWAWEIDYQYVGGSYLFEDKQIIMNDVVLGDGFLTKPSSILLLIALILVSLFTL